MFTKGNRVYSDAGYYLHHKQKPIIGYSFIGNEEDYEEVKLPDPLDIEINGDKVFYGNGKFIYSGKIDYAQIKTKLIKLHYSNDDQLALMLNKDESEEDAILYEKMQEWRDWAGKVAKQITEG